MPQVHELCRLSLQPFGHRGVVVGREVPGTFEQRGQALIGPRLFSGLGQHEEHLEVAQISRSEPGVETCDRGVGRQPTDEFGETRIAFELSRVDMGAPGNQGLALVGCELVRRRDDGVEDRVGDVAVAVGQELLEQGRNDVEHLAFGVGAFNRSGQGRIGAARVESDPRGVGHAIRGSIRRLVEVPEKGDCRHRVKLLLVRRPEGAFGSR